MASAFRRRGRKKTGGASPSSSSNSSTEPSVLLGPKGTKPWTGGITLTSTGLRDLDQLLGGGQPVGTCIWLEEDRWTRSLALCLIQYWCAEAISQEQCLLIPASPHEKSFNLSEASSWEEDEPSAVVNKGDETTRASGVSDIKILLHSLPRNLHMDKAKKQTGAAESSTSAALDESSAGKLQPLGSLQEGIMEEEDDDEERDEETKKAEDADAGLTNAWQYRESVQRERQGITGKKSSSASSAIFCHSYDLQGRLHEQLDNDIMEKVRVHVIQSGSRYQSTSNSQQGFAYFCELLEQIKSVIAESPRTVVRLLLYHPDPVVLQVALPLLLAQIRTHLLPVVIMIAVRPWTTTTAQELASLRLLRRCSDVVLAAEGFAARREYPPPPEFRMFLGLLHVQKASTVTAATALGGGHFADATITKRCSANLYGLKRDRRKLHIELLHIPPEDYAQGGGSTGGGVRSGAGRPGSSQDRHGSTASSGLGCATTGGGGGGSSLLDF